MMNCHGWFLQYILRRENISHKHLHHIVFYLCCYIVFSICNIASFFPLHFSFFQTQGRESIAAKLVANVITESGAHRVLACDLHSGQSMGYFDIPVDHVYAQVN